jgi:hypothetical protein
MDAGGAPPAPLTAPLVAPASPAPGNFTQPDPNILAKLVALDPETGGKIVAALKNLSEMDLKQHQQGNDIFGAAAHWLEQFPPQERAQRLQIVAPQLLASGVTQEQIAGADLSDHGLRGYQAIAIDYDKMIDNELAERKFQAGDNVAVAPGGNVANIKPDGSARYVVAQPGVGGTSPGPARPASKADYDALPPGAEFIAPDGTHRYKPGGPTQPASGNFPG